MSSANKVQQRVAVPKHQCIALRYVYSRRTISPCVHHVNVIRFPLLFQLSRSPSSLSLTWIFIAPLFDIKVFVVLHHCIAVKFCLCLIPLVSLVFNLHPPSVICRADKFKLFSLSLFHSPVLISLEHQPHSVSLLLLFASTKNYNKTL